MMASKKQDAPPTEYSRMRVHTPPKDGRIPVADLFRGIYETAASAEAKKLAPEELDQLKGHLDGAVTMLQTIAKKIQASKPQ